MDQRVFASVWNTDKRVEDESGILSGLFLGQPNKKHIYVEMVEMGSKCWYINNISMCK